MDPFNKQTKILEILCQIMYDSTPEIHNESVCCFVLNLKGGWSETEFKYRVNGEYLSGLLNEEKPLQVHFLLEELHALMKAHTGGEWASFTLTLDAQGQAHVKFHYPEPTVKL